MASSVEAVISQIQNFASQASEDTRRLLIEKLHDVAVSLETSNDTIMRLIHQPLELTVCQIGLDLNLFHLLVDNEKSLSVSELASITGADPVLLARICRYCAAHRLIKEDAFNTFSATPVTKVLTHPGNEGGISHHFLLVNKILLALPEFLKRTNYRNPDDPANCAFQYGLDTTDSAFVWLQKHPVELANFMKHMGTYHEGKPVWTGAVPFSKQLRDWTGEKPLFVDVGGGTGLQCAAFKETVGNVPGKVILEDLPETLEQAPDLPGVEKLPTDFFKPQEIRGARFYYLRNVLHDHPDDKSEKILKNIIEVMEPHSEILINEIVVPNTGAHAISTEMDLFMMMAMTSLERTENQWYDLLEQRCGLKITSINTFNLFVGDSVISCRPAKYA